MYQANQTVELVDGKNQPLLLSSNRAFFVDYALFYIRCLFRRTQPDNNDLLPISQGVQHNLPVYISVEQIGTAKLDPEPNREPSRLHVHELLRGEPQPLLLIN